MYCSFVCYQDTLVLYDVIMFLNQFHPLMYILWIILFLLTLSTTYVWGFFCNYFRYFLIWVLRYLFFHLMQVIRLTKFDYRLANRLQTDLQKLRCRVNYHALRFTAPIQEMGEKLIQRMRERSKYFIALHLRCTYMKFSCFSSHIISFLY